MNEKATYNMTNVRIGQDPEQFAAFLVDWCRGTYRFYGLVPRITLNEDGSVAMVEGIQAQPELLATHTFNDAFVILNEGKMPADFDLAPGHRYIHRKAGDGKPSSQYHIPDVNYMLSMCGRVEVGQDGYELVFSREKKLLSRQCSHCGLALKQREKSSGN